MHHIFYQIFDVKVIYIATKMLHFALYDMYTILPEFLIFL